ncbi:MAG: hypothetical protein FWG94_10065 [Oscillospiraceae bacterium]|nr:hypothetical protein [Oscillospiraceae bacterium]
MLAKKFISRRILLVIVLAVLLGSAVISAKYLFISNKTQALIFNNIESLYQGAPMYYEDARATEISLDEACKILNYDISECIPEKLKGYILGISKSYFIPDEIRCIDISIVEPTDESVFGKTIIISIANKEWSERSSSSIDYVYNSLTHEKNYISNIAVDAFVHSPSNQEEDTIFIASFKINSFEYYVEGCYGITQEEFSEVVTKIINLQVQ